MELNWLKYFHEVANAQSVTRASERLKVSQPAVTKMIRQLETSLGYSLFRRNGRSMQLTAEGHALMQVCLPVFKKISEIPGLQRSLSPSTTEEIKLGASDNLCNHLLPEAVTRFRKRFPKARWMIYSGTSIEIKQKIISGELDYGLFYTALALHEKKALAEIEVTQLPFQVVYSPKIGHFKSVLELNQAKLTYVGAREKDYPNSVPEQWVHGRAGIKILDTIQTNAKETQKKFVLLGNGFGVFPQFMIESELKSGKLVPIRSVESKVSVRFVMRKNENMTALVKTFLEETLFPKNLEKNRTP